jgi:hypothetical protein
MLALALGRASAADGVGATPVTDTSPEARRDSEEGLRLFDAGHYPAAIARFEASFARSHAPGLLYNIAQAHRLNGDCSRALVFYLRYLASNPAGTSRTRTEARIADMERCLRDREPRAVATPDGGAPHDVNVPAVGASGPPPGAGPGKMRASAPLLDLSPPRPATGRIAAAARNDEPRPSPITHRWWFWTAVAAVAAGALVATAAATGVLHRDAGCPDGHRCM